MSLRIGSNNKTNETQLSPSVAESYTNGMKLFIFGSTGDLVKRKIIPAFMDLKIDNLEIIALGRKEFTDDMYQNFICNDDCFRDFKFKPRYHKVNFEGELKCEGCDNYLTKGEEHFFYSALPPKNIGILLRYVGMIKKQGFKVRVLIEKPFGTSLSDAVRLQAAAEKQNLIDDIFISDHYLFKEPILALAVRKFKKIKIVSLEKVGLENRSSYDEVGALRDMVQSHFLNIVFKLLAEPEKEFANFKIADFRRGQYGDGKTNGYVKDLGKPSETETFAALTLKTERESFEFITGKKFDGKESLLEIDDEKIQMESGNNPYARLFSDFFAKNRKTFATIENSLLAWRIIEKIESKKPPLRYYKENTAVQAVLLGKNIFDEQ